MLDKDMFEYVRSLIVPDEILDLIDPEDNGYLSYNAYKEYCKVDELTRDKAFGKVAK